MVPPGRVSVVSLTTSEALPLVFRVSTCVCVPSATHPFLCLPGQPRIFLGQLLSLET